MNRYIYIFIGLVLSFNLSAQIKDDLKAKIEAFNKNFSAVDGISKSASIEVKTSYLMNENPITLTDTIHISAAKNEFRYTMKNLEVLGKDQEVITINKKQQTIVRSLNPNYFKTIQQSIDFDSLWQMVDSAYVDNKAFHLDIRKIGIAKGLSKVEYRFDDENNLKESTLYYAKNNLKIRYKYLKFSSKKGLLFSKAFDDQYINQNIKTKYPSYQLIDNRLIQNSTDQ